MSRSLSRAFIVCALILAAAPALADSRVHFVRSGDTLSSIADSAHVSLAAIERLNGLTDRSVLQIGQVILLRPAHAVAKPVVTHVATNVVKHMVTHAANPVVGPAKMVRLGDGRGRIPSRTVPANGVHLTAGVVASAMHNPAGAGARLGTAAARVLFEVTTSGSTLPGFRPESETQSLATLTRGMRIAETALRYVGMPYWWGGTGGGGFDCSGLVYHVFAKNGVALPRMADEQYAVGRRVSTSQLRPGDLVFFQTYAPGASHVGIYVGNGNFIHASSRGVRVDALSMSYYATRYIGARRSI